MAGLAGLDLGPSPLGLGALHFGAFCEEKDATRVIHAALEHGIRFIDTAPIYGDGHSESIVGRALAGRRDAAVLTTKVGLAADYDAKGTVHVHGIPLTPDRIRGSLEQSLKALGTDYLDLYQLHVFDAETPVETTIEVLAELVAEGKIRRVGCSNFDGAQLRTVAAAADGKLPDGIVSAQCHYNMIERSAETKIFPDCRETGARVICNRALARGLLAGKYASGASLPAGSRATFSPRVRALLTDANLDLAASLAALAADLGTTLTGLSLAWLAARDDVAVVLVGVRNVDQLAQCAAADTVRLGDADMAAVDECIAKAGMVDYVTNTPATLLDS